MNEKNAKMSISFPFSSKNKRESHTYNFTIFKSGNIIDPITGGEEVSFYNSYRVVEKA